MENPVANPVPPFAVQLDEGVTLKTPTAGHVIVRADTSQTNASLTVLEFLVPPNDGPAVHAHLREDEVWYVIEGDFRFKAGEEMFRVSTGGMAFGPRGLPHAFQNVGDELGRLLVITTPSGLERFRADRPAAATCGPRGDRGDRGGQLDGLLRPTSRGDRSGLRLERGKLPGWRPDRAA